MDPLIIDYRENNDIENQLSERQRRCSKRCEVTIVCISILAGIALFILLIYCIKNSSKT